MTVEHARAAAQRGWHVFPCKPGQKTPPRNLTRWEQRASTGQEKITAAWEACPEANIGLACGPSGLVVIDLDTHGTLPLGWRDEPGIRDGADVLAVLCERYRAQWPDTYTVNTPSDGTHYYFTAPAGTAIRNSASKIGPLVDVRASGGYVLAAGSVIGGVAYEALAGDDPVVPLPGWLALLAARKQQEPAAVADLFAGRTGRRSGLRSPLYARRALGDELDRLKVAGEGTRNVTLNNAALALGTLCATGELDIGEVVTALADTAAAIGLPPAEARATIASGLRAGLSQPRAVV